jgi:CTP:molybdopterin cytidylyltransferase MocA
VPSKPYILIPAAGQSRRYRDEGWMQPKPLLWVRDKEGNVLRMVQFVLRSAPPTVFGRVRIGFDQNVHVPMMFGSFANRINNSTGQADTIRQMVRLIPDGETVLILDCDMVLRREDIEEMIRLLDNYPMVVAVTETFDPNASRVDRVPFPKWFAEKTPISSWGMVGARAFHNSAVLREALDDTFMNQEMVDGVKQELYLSHVLNHYKGKAYAHVITEFQDWGTPERLRQSGANIVGDE